MRDGILGLPRPFRQQDGGCNPPRALPMTKHKYPSSPRSRLKVWRTSASPASIGSHRLLAPPCDITPSRLTRGRHRHHRSITSIANRSALALLRALPSRSSPHRRRLTCPTIQSAVREDPRSRQRVVALAVVLAVPVTAITILVKDAKRTGCTRATTLPICPIKPSALVPAILRLATHCSH